MKMTVEQAKQILELQETGDVAVIKKQFRKLMTRYHPDALGSDKPEHIRYAQQLNEAYRILKEKSFAEHNQTERKRQKKENDRRHTAWKGERNDKAFCERSIYQHYAMDDASKNQFYETTRGKYMWDPSVEDFTLFLRSLRQASETLLGKEEEKYPDLVFDSAAFRECRFAYQTKIFHALSYQFIHPYKVLRHYCKPKTMDDQGREIYVFQGFLGAGYGDPAYRRLASLKSKQAIFPDGFQNNRILVADDRGERLGHLYLGHDPYYLCLIPLLKAKAAQIKMVVSDIVYQKCPSQIHAVLEIAIRMEAQAKDYRNASDNQKIEKLLADYGNKLSFCLRN